MGNAGGVDNGAPALAPALQSLLAEATALGATFRLCGARVALGGTPLPGAIKAQLRAQRDELWTALGGAELDRPALELMRQLGVTPVLIASEPEAQDAIAAICAEADQGDGSIGFDIETAPDAKLSRTRPPLRLKRDGTPAVQQPGHDDRAGLQPHLARIVTAQVYAGGDRAYVFPPAWLEMLWSSDLLNHVLVMHNAGFELGFLQHAGIASPQRFECTMQAAGLLLGVPRRSLDAASVTYLGLDVPKTLQTSDWRAPVLSPGQVAYAAAGAVLARRLWPRLKPGLIAHGRWDAYELQREVIRPVVGMELRGLGIDLDEHAQQAEQWACDLADARNAFLDLTGKPPPSSPAEVRDWLRTVLPAAELARWPRTDRGQQLSVKRADLMRAAHIPSARPVLAILAKEKLLSSFGTTLRKQVNPTTGRLHASYNVAAAKSGRFTASSPNLQQLPARKAPGFKRCVVAAPGHVLIGCDWSQIEMRAAAWIAQDDALTEVFAERMDLHAMNAAAIAGCPLDEVTDEMRQAAKAVSFGSLYGMSPSGLVAAAWDGYGVEMEIAEAEAALARFFSRYHALAAWRDRNADECQRLRRIPIASGRVVEQGWETQGLRFTQCCNIPIQGACADAMMVAILLVHRRLIDAGVDGGLVAAVHDELLVEVAEADADLTVVLLQEAMVSAFVTLFPGAPIDGVAVAKVGKTWADTK